MNERVRPGYGVLLDLKVESFGTLVGACTSKHMLICSKQRIRSSDFFELLYEAALLEHK